MFGRERSGERGSQRRRSRRRQRHGHERLRRIVQVAAEQRRARRARVGVDSKGGIQRCAVRRDDEHDVGRRRAELRRRSARARVHALGDGAVDRARGQQRRQPRKIAVREDGRAEEQAWRDVRLRQEQQRCQQLRKEAHSGTAGKTETAKH